MIVSSMTRLKEEVMNMSWKITDPDSASDYFKMDGVFLIHSNILGVISKVEYVPSGESPVEIPIFPLFPGLHPFSTEHDKIYYLSFIHVEKLTDPHFMKMKFWKEGAEWKFEYESDSLLSPVQRSMHGKGGGVGT